MTCRVVVLLSGRGSNLQAIAEAQLPIDIVAVVGNRPQAAGLAYARERGLTAVALDHTAHPDRAAFAAASESLDPTGAGARQAHRVARKP